MIRIAWQNVASRLLSPLLIGLVSGAGAMAQAPASTDPVVAALLDTNPQTPEQLLEVIGILVDLKAGNEAKPLLDRLAAQPPAEDELARLARRFGSSLLMKLALTPELQPGGMQLATALATARAKSDRDPARIAAQIARLNDPELSVRAAAASNLMAAGPLAAGELVNVLADAGRESESPGVVAALIAFNGDAIDPIAAALATDDARLRHHLITVLSQLRSEQAVPWLLRPALLATGAEADARLAAETVLTRWEMLPSGAQAAAQLYQLARAIYRAPPPLTAPTAAVRWVWDPTSARLASSPASSQVVEMDRASRFLDEGLAIAPGDANLQTLHLATRLEAEVRAGADAAFLANAVRDADPQLLQAVARLAADSGHTAVAVAALQSLSQANPEVLFARAPQPSELVELCRHPDRQVRFAALAAVMGMKPPATFPGSSFVTEALRYFLSTSGTPRALVVDMQPAEAQRLAGMLAELGYQPDVAYDPRTALAMALASPDYELALIDVNLASLTSGELLSQLRRDNRTARLPVGVVSSPFERFAQGNFDLEAELLARRMEFLDRLADQMRYQLDLWMATSHSLERDLVDIALNVPKDQSIYDRLLSPDRAGAFSMTMFDEQVAQSLDNLAADTAALDRARGWLARQLLIKATADFSRCEGLEVRFPGVQAFVRPYTSAGMQTQVARMLEGSSGGSTAADRLSQARQALTWLADADPQAWQPVSLQRLEGPLCEAAWQPALSEPAIRLLGRLGSPAAQRTLVEVASVAAQPLEVRQAAAAAFAESVKRFGTLLTTGEIVVQYDRYNASESLDAPTQQLLASILDTVEARAAAHPALPNVRLDVP